MLGAQRVLQRLVDRPVDRRRRCLRHPRHPLSPAPPRRSAQQAATEATRPDPLDAAGPARPARGRVGAAGGDDRAHLRRAVAAPADGGGRAAPGCADRCGRQPGAPRRPARPRARCARRRSGCDPPGEAGVGGDRGGGQRGVGAGGVGERDQRVGRLRRRRPCGRRAPPPAAAPSSSRRTSSRPTVLGTADPGPAPAIRDASARRAGGRTILPGGPRRGRCRRSPRRPTEPIAGRDTLTDPPRPVRAVEKSRSPRCPPPDLAPAAGPLPGQLHGVLEPIVAGAGFELDELDVRAAGRRHTVKVVVDSDTGVGLDDIAAALPRRLRRAGPPRAPARRLLHPGGHLARRRPAADRAAALAAGAPAPGRRAAARRARVHRAGRRAGEDGGHAAGRRAAARGALRRRRARGVRWSSGPHPRPTELLRARLRASRRRTRVNVDIAALRAIERDKDIPFETVHRGDRDRAAHRLPAHRRPPAARPDRHRPQDRRRSGCWPRSSAADGAVESRVGRHPGGLRPDRRHHRPAGHPAAAARRRARAHLRRVRRQGGRDRRRRRAARRPGQRPRRGVVAAVGQTEGVLPQAEQVPGETLRARRADPLLRRRGVAGECAGTQITLTRTHPNLVRKLFALEVPEIVDGSVEIVAVAREAGHRSKIAVRSTVPGVNPKGACIGPMGARVRGVMSELAGEKIDIIDWSEDPATFVGNALSPSKVVSVTVLDARGQDRAGRRAGLPAVAGDRQGGPERPAGRPAHRLAHRHPQRRRPAGHRRRAGGARSRTVRSPAEPIGERPAPGARAE